MASLPNASQLLSSIEELGGCDGIVGPVLQLTGLVFGIEAALKAANKDLAKYFVDASSTQRQENTDAFKKQFAAQIQSLNPFDNAFMNSSDDLIAGAGSPLSPILGSPDSLNAGSSPATIALLPFSQALSGGPVTEFSPMAQTVSGPTMDQECSPAVLGGMTSVVQTDILSTTTSFRKTASNVAGVGMVLARNPVLAIQSIFKVVSRVLTSLGDRTAALTRLRVLVESTASLAVQLQAADRANDFKSQTYEAKGHVDTAADLIDTLLNDLARAGGYDSSVLNEIKTSINSARKSLEITSIYPDAVSTVLMTSLAGMLAMMDQQLQAIRKSDDELFEIFDNLSSFTSSLTSNFKVNNHFGGMFSVIRCGLRRLSAKMSETAIKDNIMLYLFQFQQWRVMLAMYHEMVNVAGNDPVPIITAGFSDESGKIAAEIEAAAVQTKNFFSPASVQQMSTAVRNFINTIQSCMKYEVEDAVVNASKGAAVSRINTALNNGLVSINLLTPLLAKAPPGAVEAAKLLNDVLAFYPQLYAMANALAKADWKQFFNADAASSSLNRMMAKYLEAAAKCCDGNPTARSAAASRSLRDQSKTRSEMAAKEDKDSEILSAASRQQELNSQYDIQDLKAGIQRIQALLKSTCFGDLVVASNQPLIFT